MSSEELQHRRKNNYKLLVDPELVKGKKKLYRLNGAIPGKAPIPDPKDPRVLKTVLGVDGSDIGLRLPRFKYDKFWTGSPPLREILISGLNELSTKGTIIKDLCETVSPTFFVKFHRHLKSRVFLGSATVSFLKAGCGEKAVDELNGTVVCGCKITVELDDRGDLAKEVYTSKDNRRFSVDSLKSDVTTPTIKADESAFFNNHENSRDDPFQSPSFFPAHPPSQKINSISTVKTKSLSSVEGSPRTSGCGLTTPTGTTPNSGISTKHMFDPILALKACLLAKKNKITSIPPLPPKEKAPPLPSEAPPPPPEAPPPQVGLEEISSEDEGTKKVQKTSSVFFEDISGEEGSPLVTKPQLIVEDITSCEEDEERGNGSVDMDISDTEQNSQIIEINVCPVIGPTSNFIPPALPPPFPSQTFLNYQLTSEGPKTPPSEVRGDRLDNSGSAHLKTRKNKFSPAKQWKVPPAVTREEKRGQDVLYCALEQLSRILLRDVEKKLVESSAFPVLDQVWDKREIQRSKALGEEPTETEDHVKPQEPYRRMLPGLVPNRPHPQDDDESTTPITPRKRLMNFKIPLVGSMYRRDNVMTATRRLHFNERGERDTRKRKNHYSDVLPRRKRRHRKEDKDERRGDYSQFSDISSEEWPSDEGRKIRDRNKNKYKKNERKENAFGPRTPSATSEEEEEEFNRMLQEEEEEEERQEEEKADSDSSLFNEIFGSSSSSDFEADIASLRRPKKTMKPSEPAIKKRSNLIGSELMATPPVTEDKVEEEEEEIERIAEYKKRGEEEEAAILNSFLEEGFDKEDVDMMRSAYLKLKEIYSELISDISWSYYPHNVVENNVTHSSGCARSEGYYKIDPSDKSRYLHHLRRSKASDDKDKNSAPPPTSSGRGNRLNHRRVASLFTSGDVSRELQQYNQLKARKKQLTFAKSTIHNWGLFALETIPADEMVVEYIGQVVRHGIADERERRYEAQGIGSSYLFRVDYDHVIDATKSGNFARFINHCCDPNCYAKIITVGNQKKIVIYSKRDIRAGEEITYDYKFPIEDEKIPCLCGAPQCRGTLN